MARWPDFTKTYYKAWTYVNGYELAGFEQLWRAAGDRKYLDYAKRYLEQCVDENGNFLSVTNRKGQAFRPPFDNLDNMMPGSTLIWIYEETKDVRYKKAAETIRRALDNYPRNRDGGFWHRKDWPGQMWIDGIFMEGMFLLRYGKSIGDTAYCQDEVARQITVFAKRAQAGNSGLYLHAIYEPGHTTNAPPRWADSQTGLSPEVWGEGLGWYALVVVQALADLPKNHPRRAEVEKIFHRLAVGLKKTQDGKTGRWFDIVDKGDRPNNWTDNSGSAMFTYALARGIELGLLDRAEFEPVVQCGYRGITANARINAQGLADIYSACDGVPVLSSYDRYVKYGKSVNAKEAVAGFLWATTIVEKPELEKRRNP